MSLVQRSLGIIHWPTSRKVVVYGLLCAALVGFTPLVWLIGIPEAQTALHLNLLQPYLLYWSCAYLLINLLFLPSAWAGREARWTAYLQVIVISPFIVGFVYLFGSMSTPMVCFYPCIIIMWAFYFDERIAWFGFGSISLWILIVGVLENAGWLPYAPVLVGRDIEAQAGTVWFFTMLFATSVVFCFCFLLCLMILSARRVQESELKRMHEALERTNRLVQRYIPTQLAERLGRDHDTGLSVPERRRLTIFSSDIEGFTHASDELDAEELAGILNEYLSEMMQIADRYHATVSHIAGDGMLILFGAPRATGDRDHALRAVRMAQAMQRRMRELQDSWFRRGFERPFRIRIGINTGIASVGDFGSEGRKLYSAVGVHVNLAMRIQSFCEPGRILMCRDTAALIKGEIHTVSRGQIPIKHLQQPVQVHEVVETPACLEPPAA